MSSGARFLYATCASSLERRENIAKCRRMNPIDNSDSRAPLRLRASKGNQITTGCFDECRAGRLTSCVLRLAPFPTDHDLISCPTPLQGNSPPVPRFQVWAQLRIDDIIVHGISGCRADRKCARPCRSVLASTRLRSRWGIDFHQYGPYSCVALMAISGCSHRI